MNRRLDLWLCSGLAVLVPACPVAVTDRYSLEPDLGAELCGDEQLDGEETDVDCGGPDCEACALGRACSVDADCASAVCTDAECAALGCSDSRRNGTETDVDCGGGCPAC